MRVPFVAPPVTRMNGLFHGPGLLLLIGIMFAAAFVPSTLLAEQPSAAQRYSVLRERYLKLRNTDARVSEPDAWRSLVREIVRFVDEHPRAPEAAFALLDASILSEQLYRSTGETERLRAAIDLLDRVRREFSKHDLADDSLIRRGDLLATEFGDRTEAERSYRDVLEDYQGSDMVPVAKARLEQLALDSKPVESKAREAALMPSGPVIVIDPGHGGEDFGAVGVGGLLEKDVTLTVAKKLEALLTERLNAVVRLTRRSDEFVPLMERTAIANDFEADLFVSLHTNASPNARARGFEVYYLDNTGDKSSKLLAERENASLRFEGPQGDLQYMLSDLIQNAKLEDSVMLANILNRSVKTRLQKTYPQFRTLGVKKAPFYVLVGAHMPCVLVEMFFIDHSSDGARLSEREFRRELSEGLFLGIQDFLSRAELLPVKATPGRNSS